MWAWVDISKLAWSFYARPSWLIKGIRPFSGNDNQRDRVIIVGAVLVRAIWLITILCRRAETIGTYPIRIDVIVSSCGMAT